MSSTLHKEEMVINLGPQHPSTHGVFSMVVTLDGEQIVDADPVIGYLHRGTEKLAEDLQYTQIIPYTDRMDYVSAMLTNYSLVHAVEYAMDLEIPERAEYLRIILMELQRVAGHMVFLGTYLLDLGAMSPFIYAWIERERILELFNEISGARMTYNFMRVGGIRYDAPPGWLDKVREAVPVLREKTKMLDTLISGNEVFLKRITGIGKYTTEEALNYSLTGVNLRCTGFPHDLRKVRPYSIYDRFDFDVVVGKNGDTLDRYYCRLLEIEQSLRIVEQALAQVPDGPVMGKVPKMIRIPAGEYAAAIESTKGELGAYIVSDGKDKPYRLKLRRPSFDNLQILRKLLIGENIANLIAILGAVDIVLGEVDG